MALTSISLGQGSVLSNATHKCRNKYITDQPMTQLKEGDREEKLKRSSRDGKVQERAARSGAACWYRGGELYKAVNTA